MMEDKLGHDERIRLEALTQANHRLSMTRNVPPPPGYFPGPPDPIAELTTAAARVESYIRNGLVPPPTATVVHGRIVPA